MKWTVHIARMEESCGALKISAGKPTRKRPLGRPRHRWQDKLKIALREVSVSTKNWSSKYKITGEPF